MSKFIYYLSVALLATFFSCQQEQRILLDSDSFQIQMDQSGYIIGFVDKHSNRNFVPSDQKGPILAVVDNGKLSMPVSIKAADETVLSAWF